MATYASYSGSGSTTATGTFGASRPEWLPATLQMQIDEIINGSSGTGPHGHSHTSTQEGSSSGGAVASQLRDLARYLNTLANETNNKSRSLEATYSDGGASGGGYASSTNEYTSSMTPGRSPQDMNDAASRRWRAQSVQKSTLLSGPSYLGHVPGSQYCIDAGLHHHHHVKRTMRGPGWDATWFLSMEQRLNETSRLLEGIAHGFSATTTHRCSSSCCCDGQARELYRVKFALLVQKLEELRQAYLAGAGNADALAAAQAELARLRREMEQKLAELHAQHVADLQKFSAERMRFDAERSAWEIERQRLLAELDALRNKPADHAACDAALNDLRRRIAELERELEAKNRRIADLERERNERIRVVVKQEQPQAHLTRNPAVVSSVDSIWGSGAVNTRYLGSTASNRPVVEMPSPAIMVTDMRGNPLASGKVEVALQKGTTVGQ